MKDYCKGCVRHHNAGHPESDSKNRKYNDWCIISSKPAYKAIGACKLNGWLLTKNEFAALSKKDIEEKLLDSGLR